MKIEEEKKRFDCRRHIENASMTCTALKKSSFQDNSNGTKKTSIGDPRKLHPPL